jgi:hypothetical protein
MWNLINKGRADEESGDSHQGMLIRIRGEKMQEHA